MKDPPRIRFAAVVLLETAKVLLWLLFSGPALFLGFWLLVVGTRRWRLNKYWVHFPPNLGCDNTLLIDRCDGEKLFYMWFLTVVAAVAGVCLLAATSHDIPGKATQKLRHRLSWFARWLRRQLPPRAFWAWWCGGINGLDLLVIMVWLTINILWGCAILQRYATLIDIFKEPGKPVWRLEIELISLAMGQLLFPNLVLLFYPVTRGSVILQVMGVSYPDAVRYHRWLGHATMCLVTAHSVGFWGVWLSEGIHVFLKEALAQGRRINMLMGGLSFLFSLALWLTSLAVARRTNYDLFYKMHHIGFWGFMLFGCMHYWGLFWYFLPGLLLYAVDGVYRLTQAADGSPAVLAASCSVDSRAVCLAISTPNWRPADTGYLWLNIPAISLTQWHPFEYVAVAADPPAPPLMLHALQGAAAAKTLVMNGVGNGVGMGGLENGTGDHPQYTPSGVGRAVSGVPSGTEGDSGEAASALQDGDGPLVAPGDVTADGRDSPRAVLRQHSTAQHGTVSLLHIKVYDRWTAALPALLAARGAAGLRVRVEGPFPELPPSAVQHFGDGMAFVAGGIGATAALSVLQEMALKGGARGTPALLVWAVRYPSELTFLAPKVLTLARGCGLKLKVVLHYTGSITELEAAVAAARQAQHDVDAAQHAQHAQQEATDSSGSLDPSNAPHAYQLLWWPEPLLPAPHPSTTPLCPVMAAGSAIAEAGQKLAVHAAAFAGALAAALAVRWYGIVLPSEPWSTAWLGAAYVLLLAAAAVGCGMLALAAAAGCARLCTACRQHSRRSQNPAATGTAAAATLQTPLLSSDGTTGCSADDEEQAADDSAGATPGDATSSVSLEGRRDSGGYRGLLLGSEDQHWAAGGMFPMPLRERSTSGRGEHAEIWWGPTGLQAQGIPIALGRPDLQQLLGSWLSHLRDYPGEEGRIVPVFAMGPATMVASVQVLCDVLNQRGGGGAISLSFQRKTHEL